MPPAEPQWVHEIKHDGYRLMVRKVGDRVRIYSHRILFNEHIAGEGAVVFDHACGMGLEGISRSGSTCHTR